MAWVKVPVENHPLFHRALPKDPRVSTLNMFGGVCALVNGNMFGGLFGRSALAKLSPTDLPLALALDGAEMFDPMGNGRVMTNTVFLPETIMDELDELRDWLRKAFDYGLTLPRKQKKKPKAAKPKAKVPAKPRAKAKSKAKPPANAKPKQRHRERKLAGKRRA